MRLGAASIAALARAEKADQAYKDAKTRVEIEVRAQVSEKLKTYEWERAKALRDADTTIISESGRSNIAALSRAIHSKDHATAKAILALTEEVKDEIVSIHPDDKLISKDDNDGKYRLATEAETFVFGVDNRGEYVGVSPSVADVLDELNAIQRVAEWEARRNG